MTEYLKPSFTVPLSGKAYSDGWERTFGCKRCGGTGTWNRHGEDTRFYCTCAAGKRELARDGRDDFAQQ